MLGVPTPDRRFASERSDQRSRVDDDGTVVARGLELVRVRGRIARGTGARCSPLQLDRGLALVARDRAHGAQGGGRVEQAPGAARAWTIQIAFEHAQYDARGFAIHLVAQRFGAEARVAQVRERHAPWLLHGALSPRHRHNAQVCDATGALPIADQKFAAPKGPVGTVPRAVPGDAEHGPASPCSTMQLTM